MEQQGYEAKFIHPLLKRHKCPICLFVMRNPVQTECGHLFCHKCLEPVLERPHPVCPIDHEDISRDSIYPDNAVRREILNLEVYCKYNSGGCTWVGLLKKFEGHLVVCQYREVQCKQCRQYIQYHIIVVHQDEECPMRPEACRYCGKDVPHQQMEDHIEKKCPDVLHACPNGCDPALKMKLPDLEQHISLKLGTCPLAEIKCPFYSYGCTFMSMRKDIPAHLKQYEIYHHQIQANSYSELKQAVDKNSASLQDLHKRINCLEPQTSVMEQLQDAPEQRVFIGGRVRGPPNATSSRIVTLASRGATLTPVTTTSSLGNGVRVITPQRIESLTSRLIELEHSVDRSLSSCLDQELCIQLLEQATYNGILLWKVDEFEHRRKEAMEGVTLSLYSTPFYTSRHGYKMCARIYLNGDGLGKNTHMSFFIVIMRGPIDELLPWPFKQKITLTLVNQMGKRHVTDSFKPDPHSSSFQRPGRREMNVASGCPRFVQQEHLVNGGFVKDDCIYIKVIVDTSDLPLLLPN